MKVQVDELVKKKGRKKKDECGLFWCVDPKTGAIKVSTNGKCDKGYIRRVNKAFRTGVILPPEEDD